MKERAPRTSTRPALNSMFAMPATMIMRHAVLVSRLAVLTRREVESVMAFVTAEGYDDGTTI